MYLTDEEIRRRIDDFCFEAEHGCEPFDADSQIGPCSVDLRLSAVYWKPEPPRPWRLGRRLPIDLTRAKIMDEKPTRGWRRVAVRATDTIVLRPGQMILGRTCEELMVPTDCAGALEGRSSYARLGLSVHAAGGFINPGYVGRMPLTLVNQSPFTIKIPVGLRLCQVMFIPLGEEPKQDYAAKDPKYLPDYGGPSYWWRDSAVRALHDKLTEARFDGPAIDHVVDVFSDGSWDNSVYERMEAHLARPPALASADALLDSFAGKEDGRQLRARAAIYAGRASLPIWLGVAAPHVLFDHASARAIILCILVALFFLPITLWGWWQAVPEYLTTKRLREVRSTGPIDGLASESEGSGTT